LKSVGIDIGTYSIKVSEVLATSKSIQLAGFREYNLSQDPAADKDIEILEILRAIHQENKNIAEVTYVVGLPTVQTSLHRIAQPPVPRFKLLESLPFILADTTPLDPDETIYDLKILKSHPNGFDVLAAAAKKAIIKKRLQVFKDAGIEPKILSVEGVALNNVFENIYGNIEKSLAPLAFDDDYADEKDLNPTEDFIQGEALLEIGHTSSILLVRSNSGLCEVRELSFGGHQLIDAICKEYRIHYKEAVNVLQNSGLIALTKNDLSKDTQRLSDTLKKALEPFLTQLKLSLLEIKSRRQVHVAGLGMLGGGSQLRNLGPYITQNLQIAANPLTGLYQFPELSFQGDKSKQLNVIVALGLALEGAKKPKNPALNFRRKEFAIKNKNLEAFLEKWSYSLQVAAIAFTIVLGWTFFRNQWAVQLSELSFEQMKKEGSEITGLKRAQINSSRLSKYIRDAEQKAQLIEKLKGLKDFKQAAYYIRQLHDQAPNKQKLSLDIEDLDINSQRLSLKGSVGSTSQLIGLEELLKDLSPKGELKERKVFDPESNGRTPFKYEVQIHPLKN
jgi:general secretion pathway protein L